jgi:hypothetical protein
MPRLAGPMTCGRLAGMPEFTDDLSVPLPPGRTPADVVDLILRVVTRPSDADQAMRQLSDTFGLDMDDAEFVYDRFCGGLVRAASRNPHNCPPADKDPIAWESFQRGIADPHLIGRVHPQFAPPSEP